MIERLYQSLDARDVQFRNAVTSAHHMGTCRMGDDPRSSVVDRNLQVHGVANLHIAGSSVFPTGGAVPPTLTIAALALRLGDHLNTKLKRIPLSIRRPGPLV